MVPSRQIRAGAAYVELTTQDKKLVAGLQRASKRLKAFATNMQNTGMKLFGGGLAAALPFGLSAKVFANFEQQMARVKALTNSSEGEFEKLESKKPATALFWILAMEVVLPTLKFAMQV